MQLTLMRNATMKMAYNGLTLLTDPMFSKKGEFESFAGKTPNPTVDLPLSVSQILNGVDGIIASHLHLDHFDKAAFAKIPKEMLVYCQPYNENRFRKEGFNRVVVIQDRITVNGIDIIRSKGRHGSGNWEKELGPVSGFVLKSRDAPCIYWAGDTVWCDEVRHTIDQYRPDIIIVHGCGAKLPGSEYIVMDARQVVHVCRYASSAKVIAIHMEALDHATVSRNQLRNHAIACGIANAALSIPEDGQAISLH